MKIHQRILHIWIICFISLAAEASGTLEFVSKDLRLDPAKLPFGKSLANYHGAVKVYDEETNSLTGMKIDWYRIDALAASEKEALKTQWAYGFSNGKLVAIQISRIAITSAGTDPEAKAALDGLLANFRKLDGKGLIRRDKDLQISYEGMCSTIENFAARITIALPNSATTQDKSAGSISTVNVISSGKTSD